jgi:hypothetical protein
MRGKDKFCPKTVVRKCKANDLDDLDSIKMYLKEIGWWKDVGWFYVAHDKD